MRNFHSEEIEYDDRFKKRLLELVEIAGNKNALAVQCGIRLSSMQSFLRRGNPPRRSLLKIARGMDVSLLWLICGIGEPTD